MIEPNNKYSKRGSNSTSPLVQPDMSESRRSEHNNPWPSVFGDGEVRAVGRLAAVLAVIAVLLILVATLN